MVRLYRDGGGKPNLPKGRLSTDSAKSAETTDDDRCCRVCRCGGWRPTLPKRRLTTDAAESAEAMAGDRLCRRSHKRCQVLSTAYQENMWCTGTGHLAEFDTYLVPPCLPGCSFIHLVCQGSPSAGCINAQIADQLQQQIYRIGVLAACRIAHNTFLSVRTARRPASTLAR